MLSFVRKHDGCALREDHTEHYGTRKAGKARLEMQARGHGLTLKIANYSGDIRQLAANLLDDAELELQAEAQCRELRAEEQWQDLEDGSALIRAAKEE